jgi:hypothetical protein
MTLNERPLRSGRKQRQNGSKREAKLVLTRIGHFGTGSQARERQGRLTN